MSKLNRRQWLAGLAAASALPALGRRGLARQQQESGSGAKEGKLALEDYVPKSMLHVKETKVERARFPAVDFHTHLSWTPADGRKANQNTTPAR